MNVCTPIVDVAGIVVDVVVVPHRFLNGFRNNSVMLVGFTWTSNDDCDADADDTRDDADADYDVDNSERTP